MACSKPQSIWTRRSTNTETGERRGSWAIQVTHAESGILLERARTVWHGGAPEPVATATFPARRGLPRRTAMWAGDQIRALNDPN